MTVLTMFLWAPRIGVQRVHILDRRPAVNVSDHEVVHDCRDVDNKDFGFEMGASSLIAVA